MVVGLVSVDREDGASGREEVEGGEGLLAAAAALVEAGLLRDGEILVTVAVMGWPGLADVVVAWRIDVDWLLMSRIALAVCRFAAVAEVDASLRCARRRVSSQLVQTGARRLWIGHDAETRIEEKYLNPARLTGRAVIVRWVD